VSTVFAGNLMMKAGSTRVLRAFGFRRVLAVNGLLNAASILACALLSPAARLPVVAAVLFFVLKPRLAATNILFSAVFQLAMDLGVALGALVVRLGHVAHGWLVPVVLPGGDFRLAFVLVALSTLGALLDALRLSAGAVGK
jgi:hypothetical protein